jgi:hypothetical protein
MWFIAMMQPPVAGTFSPSTQCRLVSVSSGGLTMPTTIDHAQPRFSWS